MRQYIIILIIISLLACGSNPTVTGTETTNGPSVMTISVIDRGIEGSTVPGAVITCVSSEYIPYLPHNNMGVMFTDTADNKGEFRFADLDVDNYSISSSYEDKGLVITGINVDESSSPDSDPIGKSYSKTDFVSGKVSRKKDGSPHDKALIYIAGTTLFTLTTDSGRFSIGGVPVKGEHILVACESEEVDWETESDSLSLSSDGKLPWSDLEMEL